MRIIDIHTHAFPDALAGRAMAFLEDEGNIKAALDGRVSSLLASMDAAGIERSVVCSIATKPEQFTPILKWSREMASERIIPFPSVHPADPSSAERVQEIADAGFKGVKLHPYHQQFDLDEERVFPIYEAAQARGLLILCHTGFDMAYPRDRKCDPIKIVRVLERFPELKLITTHLGAWEDWEEARRLLFGKPIYIETAFSLHMLSPEEAREMLLSHPREYLLFGTDSPWADQSTAVREVQALGLDPELQDAILYSNAARLLESVPA